MIVLVSLIVLLRELVGNTIKDTSTIMRNPFAVYVGRGYA